MNFITQIIDRLFGRRSSIDQITRPMNRIVRDLDKFSKSQTKQSEKHNNKAERLKTKAQNALDDAQAAESLAGNYKALITPNSTVIPTEAQSISID